MSRMASMQVLNNAFHNLNNAMATIMQDKRLRNQLEYEQLKHKADMAFRQDEALRSQSNADRAYQQAQEQFNYQKDENERKRKYQEKKDAQAQANWLADFLEKREQFNKTFGLNSRIQQDKVKGQEADRKQNAQQFDRKYKLERDKLNANVENNEKKLALAKSQAQNQYNYQQGLLNYQSRAEDARNIATFMETARKFGVPTAMAYANLLSGNGNFNTLASGIQTAVQNQAQAQAQENRKVPLKDLQALVEAGILPKADAELYISYAYPELMEAKKTETNGRKVFSGK